jgi:DNA-3-methyladenine glycosylase
MNPRAVDLSFLSLDSPAAARQLIGWRIYHCEASHLLGGIIVETEAYNQYDAASHSYRGETPRTKVMFGPPGHIYVYFTYGMHFCMNIVTGESGEGSAVLLRAIVPDKGVAIIRKRRGERSDSELTNGPAKLCQALDVNLEDNGKKLNDGEFLLLPPLTSPPKVRATTRIGITKDVDRLWRFVVD